MVKRRRKKPKRRRPRMQRSIYTDFVPLDTGPISDINSDEEPKPKKHNILFSIMLFIIIILLCMILYMVFAPQDNTINKKIADTLPTNVVDGIKNNIGWVVVGLGTLAVVVAYVIYEGTKKFITSKPVFTKLLQNVGNEDIKNIQNDLNDNWDYMHENNKLQIIQWLRNTSSAESTIARLKIIKKNNNLEDSALEQKIEDDINVQLKIAKKRLKTNIKKIESLSNSVKEIIETSEETGSILQKSQVKKIQIYPKL